ncbi:hypothetical protein FRC02_001228 [Tulasnella sp. 418]|nr:hypothetical protein FRC02_001228 [Tulasnella sp. 418]
MDSSPPSYSAHASSSSAVIDVPIQDPDLPDALPPPYQAAPASAKVPAHNPAIRLNSNSPVTYTVGKHKNIEELVHPLDLMDHLTLLRAFHQLRENVRSQSAEDNALSADDIWTVFLAIAVRRFEKWVKNVARHTPSGSSEENIAAWEEHEIPPLDVILVWHTYLLNPRIYYEDGLRLHRRFLLYRDLFPLHYIAAIIFDTPSPTRVHNFEAYTNEPFNQHPITANNVVKLECPGCGKAREVRWIEKDGSGYAQDNFLKKCRGCGLSLSRETIGIARLAKDMSRIKQSPKSASIAGLLLGPRTGSPNYTFTRSWNKNLLQSLRPHKSEEYTRVLEWSFQGAAKVLKQGFINPNESNADYQSGMKRVLKSYNTWTCLSIDLRAAVNRQFKFIYKISGLGWLEEGAFSADSKSGDGREENKALRRCVAQYHGFLDLMVANSKKFLVPTLAIDLVWHTHQLFHTEYRKWTIALVGTLVDHDDAVEQENLAMSYRQTAQLWHSRYNIPYSICGCPQPQLSSLSSASSFASKVLLKSPFSSSKSAKQPQNMTNPRPDILQVSENALDETHPSEHPSVIVTNIPELQKLRTQRLSSSEGKGKEKGKSKANGHGDHSAIDAWVDENEILRRKRETHRNDCPAFYSGFSSDTAIGAGSGIMNGLALGPADCIAGMGAMGACRAGNTKFRGIIEVTPSHSVSPGLCGGCGG